MRHRALPTRSHILPILILSTALLALSIALIALQARVQDAFPDEGRQYPGSSIAEFLFVPLNPSNIDVGPTVAKYAAGACSLLVALLGVAWPVLHWCRASGRANIVHIRMLGSAACLAAVTNAAAIIGFTVYTFVSEDQGYLPASFSRWKYQSFTQEFYVCVAIPSLFPDTNAIYGFPACQTSRASKYVTLTICCISMLLAGLSVVQAHRDGIFAVFVKVKHGGPYGMKPRPREAHGYDLPERPMMAHTTQEASLPGQDTAHNLPTDIPRSHIPLHGYYANSRRT